MLDLKFIRENPKIVKDNIKRKGQTKKLKLFDELLKLDEDYRKALQEAEKLRHQRNSLSEGINKAKKAGKSIDKILADAKKIPKKLAGIETKKEALLERIKLIQYEIPNIIAKKVPKGKGEEDNKVIKTYGKKKKFSFDVKSHVELTESLSIADFDGASAMAGNGFFYLKGDLVKLNQALIQYALSFMEKKGYLLVEPPLLIQEKAIHAVMPFTDFEEHAYKIEGKDQYLIATSEHPLVAWFQDQVLQKPQLPIKLAGYSQCFRQEIGSHGIDEKGLFRTHQFNKVEQVILCEPEDSEKYYKEIAQNSTELYESLGLPFRRLQLCTGDLSDLKHDSEDLEVWSPRKKDYFEVGSCSNLTDAQARRANINVFDGKKRYTPHSLNNTVLATSRCMVAILENYQQKDGSIEVPKVLQRYMGKKVIKKK